MMTPRQKQVLDYLTQYIGVNSIAPTMAEIGKHMKLSSPASVHHLLTGLEQSGAIRRIPNVSRGIELVEQEQTDSNEIPLLGTVAAGQPITAILNHETLNPDFRTDKARLFALRVRGDSMTGEWIRDGDCIIVEARKNVKQGEMVVALVDGCDATVKRFYSTENQVRLEPANPRYRPILLTADRVEIQGVVTGVIRRY